MVKKSINNKCFKYELQIKEHHLDMFGHVNNATYLQILEEARWDFITNEGYGLDQIQSGQLGPVILEINIRFKRELLLREEIVIKSFCTDQVPEKFMNLTQQIFVRREDSLVLACEAHLMIGLMDMNKRKLVRPTQDWLKAIGMDV